MIYLTISESKVILVLITNSFYNFTKWNSVENNGEYVLGPKGSGSCSEGTQIIDEASCREACRTLNLPHGIVLGNHKCYKNKQGKCFQDGRQGSGASLICKTSGQNPGRFLQGNKNPCSL